MFGGCESGGLSVAQSEIVSRERRYSYPNNIASERQEAKGLENVWI